MRIWEGAGGLMTDEQLLRLLAHYGSLDAARAAGNVTLVSETGDAGMGGRSRDGGAGRGRRLVDCLEGADEH
ncbi:MAG: hypothetical protein MR874_12025 [Coriobacteriaceae bacterium]|nr:hypothetical protein [Coriobacteriaceae bacterium]MCI6845463.1 hypothetical protein [Coriobacteriaceae bacterium]MDD7585292.1 hypothetical protein [Coriobacteriaceae bacterium]